MPENQVSYNEIDHKLLEYIRQREGFATIDEAGDFLAKLALRRKLYEVNKRGRAQHIGLNGEKK